MQHWHVVDLPWLNVSDRLQAGALTDRRARPGVVRLPSIW